MNNTKSITSVIAFVFGRSFMDKKKITGLVIGYLGSMLALFGLVMFNSYLLMSIPLVVRMVAMIVLYWLLALVPAVIMLVDKEKLSDYGFSAEKIPLQIVVGVIIGVLMSVVRTLIPPLAGYGEYFNSGNDYSQLWQFVYEFIYCIIAVGFAEEFIFRGFIFSRVKSLGGNNIVAVIVSSVLFGFFHIFGGNPLQIFTTALIGAFFCLCRLKIKNCTLLSLIIAHGVYDALITVWSNVQF